MQKSDIASLGAGHEFAPAMFSLDSQTAQEYIDLTGDDREVYRAENALPPMLVAARSMAALMEGITFPDGSIHVSQELKFFRRVSGADVFTSRARISRKHERGKLRLMTIDIIVSNQNEEEVLSGKITFMLPQQQD